MRTPSHRLRFGIGLALGAALAAALSQGFVGEARRRVARETEERKATVALEAAATLVKGAGGEGDEVRRVLAAWREATPGIAQARVAHGMQLEASTFPGDSGPNAAPRRLTRDEKPFFDRSQRIASAIQTNREEQGARKAEVEAEWIDGGRRLSLAGPVEVGGSAPETLEVETAQVPAAPRASWLLALLAFASPVAAFALFALLVGERRLLLAGGAFACLALAALLALRSSTGTVAADIRRGAEAVSGRVKEQAAVVRSLGAAPALVPADLDVDPFRRPRGELLGEGTVDPSQLARAVAESSGQLRLALLLADALALLLLLLAGFGAFVWLGRTLSRNRQAYLYIAPAIFGMLVLVFYPFAYGITLSFTDSNLYNTNQSIADIWVGLRNYVEILSQFSFVKRTPTGLAVNYLNFYWTLLFTVVWTVTNVSIGVSSGLFLALILNTRALAFRPLYRVLLILPWAMPNYITSLIWKGMFHQQFGVVNQALQIFRLPAVNWFDRPFTSFLTALTTNAWLSFPFMMVVSLGALQSIPADLYEAARVDGASRWQAFRAITLPSLRPALVPAVILSVVWTFNMFNVIYLVTAGAPDGSTEILVTQAYKYAFERYRYGYAAAYSTVIFGILLVYGVIQNRMSRATEA